MATVRSRGRLPHWEQAQAIYFVTFRLADSLSKNTLRQFEFERRDIVASARAAGRDLSAAERNRLAKLFSERVESKLDAGVGSCIFRDPTLAAVVAAALRKFDVDRYHLFAWCVMPNHVHAVFRPLGDWNLERILHTWKSYSAKELNRLLRRSKTVWQREYFDHLVRDENEFLRILNYVAQNPERAGLRDWRWVGGSDIRSNW